MSMKNRINEACTGNTLKIFRGENQLHADQIETISPNPFSFTLQIGYCILYAISK